MLNDRDSGFTERVAVLRDLMNKLNLMEIIVIWMLSWLFPTLYIQLRITFSAAADPPQDYYQWEPWVLISLLHQIIFSRLLTKSNSYLFKIMWGLGGTWIVCTTRVLVHGPTEGAWQACTARSILVWPVHLCRYLKKSEFISVRSDCSTYIQSSTNYEKKMYLMKRMRPLSSISE